MKEKEPASWRWEKQEFERQLKDLKKKYDDLQEEMKKMKLKARTSGLESKVSSFLSFIYVPFNIHTFVFFLICVSPDTQDNFHYVPWCQVG